MIDEEPAPPPQIDAAGESSQVQSLEAVGYMHAIGDGQSAQAQQCDGGGSVVGFSCYCVYDSASGRIVKYGRSRDMLVDGGASMAAQIDDPSHSVIAVSALPNPDLYYVPGDVLTLRPACPVTASVAARVVSLAGVPIGAPWNVKADDTYLTGNAVDAVPQFTFAAAGVYKIGVTCFPAIDFLQEFTLA